MQAFSLESLASENGASSSAAFFTDQPSISNSHFTACTILGGITSASKLGSELQESSSCNTRRCRFSGHSALLQSSTRNRRAGWCNDTPDLQQSRTLPRCERSQRDSEHNATRMGSRNQVQTGRAKQAC